MSRQGPAAVRRSAKGAPYRSRTRVQRCPHEAGLALVIATTDGLTASDRLSRGGTGLAAQVWLADGAEAVLRNLRLLDDGPIATQFDLAQDGARLVLDGVTTNAADPLAFFARGPTSSIVGAAGVCSPLGSPMHMLGEPTWFRSPDARAILGGLARSGRCASRPTAWPAGTIALAAAICSSPR